MTSASAQVPPIDRPKRVLIVDDESNQAYLLHAAIRKMPGIVVQTATSAEQALHLFEQAPFDLLLTDYRMTGMSGLELAARVHALYAHTLIVMLTGFANSEIRERARQISIFRVLDKPADIGEIRAIIQSALAQARDDSNPADDCPGICVGVSEAVLGEDSLGNSSGIDMANLRRRILVVEDDSNQAMTMRLVLRKIPNAEVLTAASAEQALRLFQEEPFDLLITDFKMSGLDGLLLAQVIRGGHPHLPIIMLTAFGDDALRDQAQRVPIHTILSKPAGVDEIRQTVLDALAVNSTSPTDRRNEVGKPKWAESVGRCDG